MDNTHEENANAQRDASHKRQVVSHRILYLGYLCSTVLPWVFFAKGFELVLNPWDSGVESSGDCNETSKDKLKDAEENTKQASALGVGSPVTNNTQKEDDYPQNKGALHSHPVEYNLSDVHVLGAVNIA